MPRKAWAALCGTPIAALAFSLLSPPSEAAATTYTLVNLDAAVSGGSVTATATVKASGAVQVDAFGVCVRDADGGHHDFWKRAATITATGTLSEPDVKPFPVGTYTYFACVRDGHGWTNLQGKPQKTFTVESDAGSPAPSSTPKSAATGVTASAGDRHVVVTWTAVRGATGYLVGRDGADSKGTGPWSTTDPASTTSRDFTNLVNGTSYTFTVTPQPGGSPMSIRATPAAAATPSPTPTATPPTEPTARPTPTAPTSPRPSPTSASPTPPPAAPPTTVLPYGSTPRKIKSWKPSFGDEFNGTSLDHRKWDPAYCGRMNNTTVDPTNITVRGGLVSLRLGNGKGSMITSSSRDACGSFDGYLLPVGGYAEARVRFPVSAGKCANWPAWWISGPKWPTAGEHDIAEVLTGKLTVNYHSSSGAHNQGTVSGTWCGGWHTYGIYRGAKSAQVYWDGQQVKTYATDDNGKPQSLILNMGSHASSNDPSQVLQADYIRAWQ